MSTVLAWIFFGAAVVGIVSGAIFVATAMSGFFDRHHHHHV